MNTYSLVKQHGDENGRSIAERAEVVTKISLLSGTGDPQTLCEVLRYFCKMSDAHSTAEAIRHIMATLFSAQNALRALAPEFRWAGLGNLLGDYGQCVAIKHYGLTKANAGSGGYDARTPDGKTVQIKTSHASDQIGFRGDADLMLVIKVDIDGTWRELYFGDFAAVKAVATISKRDNKFVVTLSKLASIARRAASAKAAD